MKAAAYKPLAQIVDQIVEARHHSDAWPELNPLPPPPQSKAGPFPVSGLGTVLGGAVAAIANDVQVPDALAAGSVLATSALAVQPLVDVALPHGQKVPTSLFIVSGAGSGDRKSATDALACAPVETARRNQVRSFASAQKDHEQVTGSHTRGEGPAPRLRPQSLTVSRGTIEGLHQLLRGQSHLGLFSPEGVELLSGHSMREERRASGIAWLLKAWSGETLDTLTKGDGLSVLFGRRISLHALVQPVVLQALLADPLATGQGLLARCLIAQPDSLAGTRLYRVVDPSKSQAIVAFHRGIDALLRRAPPIHLEGDGFELAPVALKLSPSATDLWIEWHDDVERKQREDGELWRVRPFASKCAEHAARIAGVIQMVEAPDAAEISEEVMAGAIEVAGFYLDEHLRLTGLGIEQQRVRHLRVLLEWISQMEGRRVPHAQVLQYSPREVRAQKAEGLASLLQELTTRGYVRRREDVWEARPDAC